MCLINLVFEKLKLLVGERSSDVGVKWCQRAVALSDGDATKIEQPDTTCQAFNKQNGFWYGVCLISAFPVEA